MKSKSCTSNEPEFTVDMKSKSCTSNEPEFTVDMKSNLNALIKL